MKVTGFSFIKNALLYDYPIAEAITSILPVCDEFIIAVGKSTDDTLNLVKNINSSKIKILETEWDETLREGGKVLATETNKAFQAISDDTDWAFYIQGDEVVHEKYLDAIYKAMLQYKNDKNIDGLLFNYLHFYGSYDFVGGSSRWYTHEIRVIKNNKNIYAYRDAQGFRKNNNEKLKVKPIDAYIYHYGWVKPPVFMQNKLNNFHRYWHTDDETNNQATTTEYDYFKNIQYLKPFTLTHPTVMQKRIDAKNWQFDISPAFNRQNKKDKFKAFCKKYLRLDFNYRNYIVK
jgi:hypothetical protein